MAFTFCAIMASGFGAKVLGLIIMAPLWYFVLRRRSRTTPGGSSQINFNASTELAVPDGSRKVGGSTRSFYYRRGRNTAGALILGALPLLAGKWGSNPGHHTFLIFATVCALGAVACAMHAIRTGPALASDRNGMSVRSMFAGLVEEHQSQGSYAAVPGDHPNQPK